MNKEERNVYYRKYYQNHKEIIKARNRKWEKENKEKVYLSRKKWQDEHKDKVYEYQKLWRKKNSKLVSQINGRSRKRRIERLRSFGCTNAYMVVLHKAIPKFNKEIFNNKLKEMKLTYEVLYGKMK